MDYARLTTEKPNPRTPALDALTVRQIIDIMNREDRRVAFAVGKVKSSIAQAVERIVRTFRRKGRLFFVGAGTSGRLGVMEAAECPPTFDTPPHQVQAIIAGGKRAFTRSVEGAEDRTQEARREIARRRIEARDTVVGVAASGVTPFVRAALREAKRRGASTVLVTCNCLPRPSFVDIVIAPPVGPEIVAGSTRLKAGTATKMVLNMLTTTAMIRIGKVYQNWMVDLQPKSKKLRHRACRIVMRFTGLSRVPAQNVLRRAHSKTKVAILMVRKHLSYERARTLLSRHCGFLHQALHDEGAS